MKTLKLTLHKKAFDVMASGEKKFEYRAPSNWILSRLVDKYGNVRQYHEVEFTNGYGATCPRFRAEYIGFKRAERNGRVTYSNGLVVEYDRDTIVIELGKIILKENCLR